MAFEVLEGEEMEWPAYLDEYEKLVIRMNTPRFVPLLYVLRRIHKALFRSIRFGFVCFLPLFPWIQTVYMSICVISTSLLIWLFLFLGSVEI